MLRAVTSTIVLTTLLAATDAPSAPVGDPATRAVGRFIGEDTFAVVHVDTSRLEPAGMRQWVAPGSAGGDTAESDQGRPQVKPPPMMEAAAHWVERANRAGVEDVYLVIKFQPRGLPVPAVVVPVTSGDDAIAIQTIISPAEGWPAARVWGDFTTATVGDAIVLAPREALARFHDAKPTSPAWMSSALAAVGPRAVRAAMAPGVQMKVMIEGAANGLLDDPLAGDPRGFPEAVRWVGLGLGAPPDGTLQLIIQADRPDAADYLAKDIQQLLESAKAAGALQSFVSDPVRFIKTITPKVQGNQVVLTLTGQQVAELLSQFRSKAAQRRSEAPNKLPAGGR